MLWNTDRAAVVPGLMKVKGKHIGCASSTLMEERSHSKQDQAIAYSPHIPAPGTAIQAVLHSNNPAFKRHRAAAGLTLRGAAGSRSRGRPKPSAQPLLAAATKPLGFMVSSGVSEQTRSVNHSAGGATTTSVQSGPCLEVKMAPTARKLAPLVDECIQHVHEVTPPLIGTRSLS